MGWGSRLYCLSQPKPETAFESVVVFSGDDVAGEIFEEAGIATAHDDVFGLHGGFEKFDDDADMFAPFFLAHLLKGRGADVLFVGVFVAVGEMGQLQGLEGAIDDHGRAQAGAQSQKEHVPAAVAAQGLHGGVVHHLGGFSKGAFEIEFDPALGEVVGLGDGLAIAGGTGAADGDGVVLPAGG
jgi:hypothetical protein